MTRTQKALIGALFGIGFAVTSILRDAVAPGLVGGALAAILVYLVLTRVQEQHELRRRRARERSSDGT